MQSSRPPLIIVSGAPGSGKTTLSHRLEADLALPLISKDELKEALADAIGVPSDVSASMQLGAIAYASLYSLRCGSLKHGPDSSSRATSAEGSRRPSSGRCWR